jgi:hypothetical protein
MGRKKLLYKGGEKIDTTQGPLLPVYLTNKEKEDLEALSKTYEQKAVNLKFKLNQAQHDKDKEQESIDKEKTRNMNYKKLNETARYHTMQLITKYLFGFMAFIKQIFIFSGAIFKEAVSIAFRLVSLIYQGLGVGNGTLLRYVCAFICIILIFTGGFALFKGLQQTNPSFNNSVVDNILKADASSFLTVNSPTFFSKFSNGLFSMVPDKYKYSFGAMTGSFNYMITGKNQFENYLEKRETVENDVGRSDNIFNINFKNNNGSYVSNKTYSILKPNDISIVFEGKNPIFDINRLSDDFTSQPYFGFYDKYTVPVVAPTSNWILDVNNAYYSSNTLDSDPQTIKDIRIPANKQNNIFKINEKGQVIYNSFLNKNFYVDTIQHKNSKIGYLTNYSQVINNLMTNHNILNSSVQANKKYSNIISRLTVSNSYSDSKYYNIISYLDEKYKIDINLYISNI